MTDRVAFEAPLDQSFGPVVRLVVGGVAERADFRYEDMDDLQLAVERLLADAGGEGKVMLTFELSRGRIRARIGPLRESGLARALQEEDDGPGTFTLRRILSTVVDSYGIEHPEGGEIVVRLEKLVEGQL